MSEAHGFLCSPHIYKFEGLEIERPGIGGPCPLKANGDPYERMPAHVAEKMARFWRLTESEMEAYRIGGGCRSF